MSTATAPLTVTDAASRKIAQLAAKEGRAEPILRLRVVAGGAPGSPTSSASTTPPPMTTT